MSGLKTVWIGSRYAGTTFTPFSYDLVSLDSGSFFSRNATEALTACSASSLVSLKIVELCTPVLISLTDAISAS
jgi:hypothetical protein